MSECTDKLKGDDKVVTQDGAETDGQSKRQAYSNKVRQRNY